jgi:hypothetical protein
MQGAMIPGAIGAIAAIAKVVAKTLVRRPAPL